MVFCFFLKGGIDHVEVEMTEAEPGEDFDNEEDDGQQNEYSELLSVSLVL